MCECLPQVEFIAACDVDNPLTGPPGASAVFGPQKGADAIMVKQLDAALDRPAVLEAPLSNGAKLGMLKVSLNDQMLVEIPLVALNEIQRGGLIRRLIDTVYLMME